MKIDKDMTLAEKAEIVKSLASAIADGKVIEKYTNLGWERMTSLHFHEEVEYRVRNFIEVNAFKIPMPESVAPIKGTAYYIPSVYSEEWYMVDFWQGSETNLRHLKRDVVHLQKEDAIKHAKAMAGQDPSFLTLR